MLLISAGIGATPVLAMLQALARSIPSGRSGGCTARAAAATTRSPSRPRRCSPRFRMCAPTSATAVPVRATGKVATSNASGRVSRHCSPSSAAPRCRGLPVRARPVHARDRAGLAAMGLDASRVHTEPFGPAPGLTPGMRRNRRELPPARRRARQRPTIEFARSGLAVAWSSDYASLLELAEACDVPVRWSCRTGVCHNCESASSSAASSTAPIPSNRPPREARSSAARSHATTSCSICDGTNAGPPRARGRLSRRCRRRREVVTPAQRQPDHGKRR